MKIEKINFDLAMKGILIISLSLMIGLALNDPLNSLFFSGMSGSWVDILIFKIAAYGGAILLGAVIGAAGLSLFAMTTFLLFWAIPKVALAVAIIGAVLGALLSSMIVVILRDYWIALAVAAILAPIIYLYSASKKWI